MYQAATDSRFTLFIEHDPDPLNPRADCDPFGRMICFHRRYSLGDKHDYDSPDNFLDRLLVEHKEVVALPLYGKLMRGQIRDSSLSYDRSSRKWVLRSYGVFSKMWYDEKSYPSGLRKNNLPQSFVHDVSGLLQMKEKLDLLSKIPGLILLPLYLYDHTIRSISTRSFIGRAQHAKWDSSQVGWTYATPEMIREAYGEVSAETIESARKLLVGEADDYDNYLRGECYGYRLFDEVEEIDSCWGFLGDAYENAIREHLPDEARHLVDDLDYISVNSAEEYFAALLPNAG